MLDQNAMKTQVRKRKISIDTSRILKSLLGLRFV